MSSIGAVAPRATDPTNNTPSTSQNTSTSNAIDSQDTFLSLLVTELKSQDPTSPMDPMQMVGQMLSMNQLDQLIQINQTLQVAAGTSTSTTTGNQSTGGN